MDAPAGGARPSTLLSEIRWAARVRGDALRTFVRRSLDLTRLFPRR